MIQGRSQPPRSTCRCRDRWEYDSSSDKTKSKAEFHKYHTTTSWVLPCLGYCVHHPPLQSLASSAKECPRHSYNLDTGGTVLLLLLLPPFLLTPPFVDIRISHSLGTLAELGIVSDTRRAPWANSRAIQSLLPSRDSANRLYRQP